MCACQKVQTLPKSSHRLSDQPGNVQRFVLQVSFTVDLLLAKRTPVQCGIHESNFESRPAAIGPNYFLLNLTKYVLNGYKVLSLFKDIRI